MAVVVIFKKNQTRKLSVTAIIAVTASLAITSEAQVGIIDENIPLNHTQMLMGEDLKVFNNILLTSGQRVPFPLMFSAVVKPVIMGSVDFDKDKRCTASIVGPSTILTSGHCFKKDIYLGSDTALPKSKCVSFHDYKIKQREAAKTDHGLRNLPILKLKPGDISTDGTSEDWALCAIASKISIATYETININHVPKPGDIITLSGYGCINPNPAVVVDGYLRIGESKVIKNTRGSGLAVNTFQTKAPKYSGFALLCKGDSGGPAYYLRNNDLSDRVIIGVNMKGDAKTRISTLAVTTSSAAKAFFISYAQTEKVKICGINFKDKCRGMP